MLINRVIFLGGTITIRSNAIPTIGNKVVIGTEQWF
jgi:serine acetyltransferase